MGILWVVKLFTYTWTANADDWKTQFVLFVGLPYGRRLGALGPMWACHGVWLQ